MAEKTVFGMDLYWLNFYGLMILTLIEVLAVGANLDPVAESLGTEEKVITLWILTMTALFPAFFILIMVLFVGLTHPDAASSLPDWCRPGTYGL